ncbi:MAG: hypothetical protein CR997_06190 [Acidobacteria bacterium]|nr:MAG: hypothetical protein CR997_06190 [Acidobacteriota bacterium]
MHILVTDSGVGGLSVFAQLEQHFRKNRCGGKTKLTFVNACPEDDYGYNAMSSRREKLDTFDRVLFNASRAYQPDCIYIACNTLSVIYQDTDFFKNEQVPVFNIVDTGVRQLMRKLKKQPHKRTMLFATVTTIREAVILKKLMAQGVPSENVIRQACPRLADVISTDLEGARTRKIVQSYVSEALARVPQKPESAYAYLGCTHYGYRKALFVDVFKEQGVHVETVNPNEGAVEDLLKNIHPPQEDKAFEMECEVVSRYPLSKSTQATLTHYLYPVSPATVEAIKSVTLSPHLF